MCAMGAAAEISEFKDSLVTLQESLTTMPIIEECRGGSAPSIRQASWSRKHDDPHVGPPC